MLFFVNELFFRLSSDIQVSVNNALSLHQSTIPLLTAGGPVLVGLSGGRDSVALLVSLVNLPGCFPVACHIHHGIREETADRDALFSKKLAKKLHIPFYQANVDAPLIAREQKISIEEAARHARQLCFLKWRNEGLGSVVALAQHRNDQAETVLMNLCRGGAGLRGMKPVTEWPQRLPVVRPLLDCSRSEITAFLTLRGYSWVEDESNDETHYTRNALRHDVMPVLDRIMERDVSLGMARAARLAGEQQLALEQAMDALSLVDPQGRLFLPKVNELPQELQKAVIFHYMKSNGLPDLSEDCVTRVLAILGTESPSRASLPGGWTASRKEHRLRLIPPNIS